MLDRLDEISSSRVRKNGRDGRNHNVRPGRPTTFTGQVKLAGLAKLAWSVGQACEPRLEPTWQGLVAGWVRRTSVQGMWRDICTGVLRAGQGEATKLTQQVWTRDMCYVWVLSAGTSMVCWAWLAQPVHDSRPARATLHAGVG